MTATLRERAERAAKYGSNLMVPARELLALLDRADLTNGDVIAAQWQAESEPWQKLAEQLSDRLHAVRELHVPFEDKVDGICCQECSFFGGDYGLYGTDWPCSTILALNEAPALAEGGEQS